MRIQLSGGDEDVGKDGQTGRHNVVDIIYFLISANLINKKIERIGRGSNYTGKLGKFFELC